MQEAYCEIKKINQNKHSYEINIKMLSGIYVANA